MGNYSDGSIYGVCLIVNGEEIYKKVYESKLSKEEINEVKEVYNKVNEGDNLIIRFYTKCSSRYNSGISGSFTSWFPGSRETLHKLLNND